MHRRFSYTVRQTVSPLSANETARKPKLYRLDKTTSHFHPRSKCHLKPGACTSPVLVWSIYSYQSSAFTSPPEALRMSLIVPGLGNPIPLQARHIVTGDRPCSFAHLVGFSLTSLRYFCSFMAESLHYKKNDVKAFFMLDKVFHP